MSKHRAMVISVVLALLASAVHAGAQVAADTVAQPASSGSVGLEVGAVPAVNFDSDEGFGYGVIAELYQYGAGDVTPYVWTLQPTLFFTTEGRRDVTVFFDAPNALPEGWRMTGFAGRQEQIATPWYGIGNETPFDESLAADDGPNPFFYRFGLIRSSLTADIQTRISDSPLRFLFGVGFERAKVDPVPDDEGTTLYAQDHGLGEPKQWLNYVRAGFVWDTRDRETGPRSGGWTEFLVRRTEESLGADVSFTRVTLTDRRYVELAEGLVFAHRYLVQHVSSDAPQYELFQVQTSFKQQEGLGGAKTVRGVLRNRYVGRGMVVWNSELRWRAADIEALGRDFHLVLSGFLDQGRVWADGLKPEELFEDLHRGYGGGLRVGMGENFTVAVDVGTAADTGLGLYLGLGYLY